MASIKAVSSLIVEHRVDPFLGLTPSRTQPITFDKLFCLTRFRNVGSGSIAPVLPGLYQVRSTPSETTCRRRADFVAKGHNRTPALAQAKHYSITSSARASTLGGIARRSAFAVLRLIASSNFVGCSTGRSDGLAPFKILSTWIAANRKLSTISGP